MLKSLIRLMRPKHYLKNALVFLPLIFSGLFTEIKHLEHAAFAFMAFSFIASAVYIVNDVRDRELDRRHPTKRYRPIASGAVPVPTAIVLAIVLVILAGALQSLIHFSVIGFSLLAGYLLINILYSFGLKNIPIADVAILSLGFVIRVFYGGDAIGVHISSWLYLAILAFSFYLSLGKRRNEIKAHGTTTRKVNRFYNQDFLDKNMYVCLGLTLIYYSLWAIDPSQPHKLMFLTVPMVIIIVMTYSLVIEGSGSDGDPVSVVLKSKPLMGIVAAYGLLMLGIVRLS